MRHALSRVASVRRTFCLTFASLTLALPSRGVAQGMSCDRARTILLSKTSTRTDKYGAMSRMVNCGDAAPGGIVELLRQGTPHSENDTLALQGAWALLDNQLMDSIRVLAVDVKQPTERRLFFLRLLTRYTAPNAAVDESQMDSDAPSVLTSVIHPGGVVGTNPLTPDGRIRARATIQTMGFHDPDPRLRKLAGLVYEEPKYHLP
jgi:hypothetical protein